MWILSTINPVFLSSAYRENDEKKRFPNVGERLVHVSGIICTCFRSHRTLYEAITDISKGNSELWRPVLDGLQSPQYIIFECTKE